ncbi:MAG: hypothetical protein IPM04_09050 [Saprospiraceae bacterium]|nr:hypothetical protein [Candidatus Brachybacter algidus]MBK8748004.1 hypothetical protein [Candidatus Brachybacter algidus]
MLTKILKWWNIRKDQIYMSHLVDFMKQNNEIESSLRLPLWQEAKVEALNDKLGKKKGRGENNHDHGHHEHNKKHEHIHGHDLVEDEVE